MNRRIFLKSAGYVIIYVLIGVEFAWAGQGRFCPGKDNLNLLSPHLQINDITIKALFTAQKQKFIYEPSFIMHIRPFELLCDLSRIIMEKEGIKIYLKVLDEDKKEVLNFEQALDEINNNSLTLLLPYFEEFREYKQGIFRIKKEHYFQVSFALADGTPLVPRKPILDLFRNFFDNSIKRKNGSAIDVGFIHNDFQNRPAFEPHNMLELEAFLGYVTLLTQPKQISEKKPLLFDSYIDIDPEPIPAALWSSLDLMIQAHTPDYKSANLTIEQSI
ncbi:MAG: hypothetical protein ABII75_06030 [Candidatus Omnitrophota bacterium]